MRVEESNLRQYLLKNLSEAETEKIDLQIFDDDEFESLLIIAEEDLIEDYIDDTLSSAERKHFEENFLTSTRRSEHLALLTQLKRESKKNVVEIAPKSLSITERIAKIFHPRFPQVAVFASLAIIVAVFGWWLIGFSGQTGEIAALNKKDLSDLSAYQKSSNLSLTTDVLRGGNDSGKNLQKDLLTENVLLRMDLRKNIATIPRLEVYRDGNRLETINDVRTYKTPSGAEIRLLLPASKMEKGAYRIEFQVENRKTTYNFSVR